jgi:Cft2 family RNA processing exonuclease
MNQRRHVGLHNARICVSGWEFQKPCRQISDREHLIALSDHSDFDGLIEYVRRTHAKQVITDNFRSDGNALAKEINRRLGISAVSMPQSQGQTTL